MEKRHYKIELISDMFMDVTPPSAYPKRFPTAFQTKEPEQLELVHIDPPVATKPPLKRRPLTRAQVKKIVRTTVLENSEFVTRFDPSYITPKKRLVIKRRPKNE